MNQADCMNMMNMQGMGWMMGVICILLLLALVLGIGALIKYLFFSGHKQIKQP